MPDRFLSAPLLRERFDRGFASPPASSTRGEALAYLGLHAHGHPFALALAAIEALHVDRKIVPVPTLASAPPSLLGLAALHGVLTPIYDLGRALGLARTSEEPGAASRCRWMVVAPDATDGSLRVGFAFASFDVHLRAHEKDHVAASATSHSPFVKRAVVVGGTAWPVVDLQALLASLKGPPSP